MPQETATQPMTIYETMDVFNKPPELSFDGNMAQNWKKFMAKFDNYIVCSGKTERTDEEKVAYLMNFIGDEALELFETFGITASERKKLKSVTDAFAQNFEQKMNVLYERFKFYTRAQQEGEPFDIFLAAIKKLASTCEFGTECDNMIRDRIVLGILKLDLQEKLIQSKDTTLAKVVEQCRLYEVNRSRTQHMQQNMAEMDAIGRQRNQFNRHSSGATRNSYAAAQKRMPTQRQSHQQGPTKHAGQQQKGAWSSSTVCKYCGYGHPPKQCKAFGQQCNQCGKMNHFARVCGGNKVHTLMEGNENPDECSDYVYIDTVETCNSIDSWFEMVKVENVNVKFKLDSGSDVNILAENHFKNLNMHKNFKLETTSVILEAYGGFKIKPLGVTQLNCKYKQKSKRFQFLIVSGDVKAILGLNACTELGLIGRVDNVEAHGGQQIINQHKSLFTGIGTLKRNQRLVIKSDAVPVAKPPRRTPIKLQDGVRTKLNELESLGIIEKVVKAANWAHNMVVVEKPDGSLRICLDPFHLNKVLNDEFYMIPTVDEITEKIRGAKFYTVLDLKDGFYQIELDEEASDLCTVSTPFGCYRFRRFPFGLKIGPELCQKYNQELFGHIEGVAIYLDDILVTGRTKQAHDEALTKVFQIAERQNVKFNPKKFQWCLPRIKYIGHIFSENGVESDPDRIKAIVEMQTPTNTKELQRFLGMCGFMRSFIPNMADLSTPLRELLKKDVAWQWMQPHADAVAKLKDAITKAPVLQIFDAKAPVVIQCDSSKDGIGYCIMQNGKPVAYGSRSLTDAQQNYGQVEKEFLAILVSCERYHHYIYGHHNVTVQTDHKPLVAIMTKPMAQIFSARLQRIRLKLLKYNLKVNYVPGKDMHIADALSRAFMANTGSDDESLNQIVHSVSVSDDRMAEIRRETQNDPALSKLINIYQDGWPVVKDKLHEDVKVYWKHRNDLFVNDAVVFLNDRIIVPTSLRRQLLQRIHSTGHFGINRTSARIKSLLFWPNMDAEIFEVVSKCSTCEKYQHANKKEPMLPHDVPKTAFEKIGCDFAGFGGKSYLVLKDYFSKWIEVYETRGKTAECVVSVWTRLFATMGFPKTIIADNQPFSSQKCKMFAKEFQIEIVNSSPLYPQSNGMSERAVQTAKSILRKAQETGKSFLIPLMEYRNTPLPGINLSPADVIFGRKLRTSIPTSEHLLQNQHSEFVHNKLKEAQKHMKERYDQHASKNIEFSPDEHVLIRDANQWRPARIVNRASVPRSYIVSYKNKNYQRNSIHIRKRKSSNCRNYTFYFEEEENSNLSQNDSSQPLNINRNQNVNENLNENPNDNVNNNANILGNQNQIETSENNIGQPNVNVNDNNRYLTSYGRNTNRANYLDFSLEFD